MRIRRLETVRNNRITNSLTEPVINSWREEAACSGLPHVWFERPDDLETTDEALKITIENISTGIDVCARCPVISHCLDDASPADLAHTVRGGQWPKSISFKPRGRPRKHAQPPRKFGPRKRELTAEEIRVGENYLANRTCCGSREKHGTLTLEHLSFKTNGAYVKARCRACVQDYNLENKRRARGIINP